MNKYQAGFTLTECLFCCAIISVLLTISFPSFNNISTRLSFRSEISDFLVNLQKAKLAAYKTNSFTVLELTSQGYTIFVDSGPGKTKGDWKRQANEKIIRKTNFPDEYIMSTNLSKMRTRFRSSPGSMKAGTITINDLDGNSANIIINTIGRVRYKFGT